MKRSYWYWTLLLAVLLVAPLGQYWLQLGVLGVGLAIFFGTLSLRGARAQDATSTHPGV
jgi:hypothetical protein